MIRYQTELSQVIKFLQRFRSEVGSEMTVQQLLTLMYVATEPGIEQGVLGERAGISSSAISKNVANLSHWKATKTPGPGILTQQIDPMRLTIRLVHLTPKGSQIFRDICSDVWGE